MAARSILDPCASLEPEEVEEYVTSVRIVLAKHYARQKDILNWGRTLFPEKFPLPFCQEMHGYFVAIRGEPFTSTEAPRYHAKTTIKCFLIPIFQALEEPSEFMHYLNAQATEKKGLDINRAIKMELEQNELIRAIYGDQVGADRWTDQQFVMKNGTVFTAVGAGQSIRGLNYRNIRPDYLVIDDLYGEEDITNPESTVKKNDWFWSSLYPARAQARRCSIHIQGTAINDEDLLKKLSTNATVVSKTFASIEHYGEEGERVLWPELNTKESLEQDRERMGSVIWFREMQNSRLDEATSVVKRSWFQGWVVDFSKIVFDKDHAIADIILGVDPSIGEKDENNPTACALVIKTRQADSKTCRYYIMGLWEKWFSLNERISLLQGIHDAQPVGRKIRRARLEGIGGFKDFVAEAKRRTTLPITIIDKVKDKLANLINKSHFFESSRVFCDSHVDPVLRDKLLYQLTNNHPKADDLRDSLLLCLDEQGIRMQDWVCG